MTQEQNNTQKKVIELTISSPVNVSVYYNSKASLLMTIDLNTGVNNDCKQFLSEETFKLIFVAKGFEKTIKFIAKPAEGLATYEFDLMSMLSEEEIVKSYDRFSALEYVKNAPNDYAFAQLQSVALEEDIVVLHDALVKLAAVEDSDSNNDYLIACCVLALGKNAVKYEKPEEIELIRNVYQNFASKESYNYIFEKFI